MEVVRFTDGETRHEAWELSDAGWDDWASRLDSFLEHAIRGIAAEYDDTPVEWLEINYWQNSGRLIVFRSQDGPHGDRSERICFELASEHLEAESRRVSESLPEPEQDASWQALASRVWRRVSECLASGKPAGSCRLLAAGTRCGSPVTITIQARGRTDSTRAEAPPDLAAADLATGRASSASKAQWSVAGPVSFGIRRRRT